MKKCRKFISLIYKKADETITLKEEKLLNEHIKFCESCMEEYKLILAVKEELGKEDYVPLPKNFKPELHKKLVEHNLSDNSRVPVFKKLPVNIAATVCLALGIAVFAFNSDTDKINSHTPKETPKTQQTEIRNIKADEETKEAASGNENTEKAASSNKEVSDYKFEINRNIPLADTQTEYTENLPAMESDDTVKNTDIQAKTAINYLTVKVNTAENIKDLIPYLEEDLSGMYLAPMEKLEEIKEILKDYDFVIKNETEETKNLEKFVILCEQP